MLDNDLIKVDKDLIRELRQKGLNHEATMLLDKYHASIRNNIKVGKRINRRINDKIRRQKYAKKGLCPDCGKKKDGDYYRCLKCREKYYK